MIIKLEDLNQLSDVLWEIPRSFRSDMRVPARIYATRSLLIDILHEKALQQLVNTATLPGVEKYVLAMPDIHQGYGFPIGGVAAMRTKDGVISPGGVGYDINCGVRLLTSPYRYEELKSNIQKLIRQIYQNIPSGVGRGSQLELKHPALEAVLKKGATWAIQQGYGFPEDLDCIEENGTFSHANADAVSHRAKQRGADQLGTLGAGNHFIELQKVVDVYDEKIAKRFGLFPKQLVVMIHTGSRGLGHQVCTDYVALMNAKLGSFQFDLPDRQLACAPFQSKEGQAYFQAMAATANFAWANRQLITYQVRKAFNQVIGTEHHHIKLTYDVAHNIAKIETYDHQAFIVHRKGATRAFSAGHKDLPEIYRDTGQPVIIPGSMGTFSYVLVAQPGAMENSFGSTCHGAGRRLSRAGAKRSVNYQELLNRLSEYGVTVQAGSQRGLVEEAPEAYKDIHNVVNIVHDAGLAHRIAKMKPIAVVKG
jgi:tRNA-splicing ligase RtcB